MDTPSASTRITPDLLAQLQDFQGRVEVASDEIAASPVAGLSATLDREDDEPLRGMELPPLWHWLYFLPRARQSQLGNDGHPRLGKFLPPVPLPRRMWAGGRLQWHAPLRVGDTVQRTSRIETVTHKAGRTGDLLFVLVRHDLSQSGHVCVTEEQDIVYRAAAKPGDPEPAPTAAPEGAVWTREIVPDPTLLFRYSALTFNGHRIHYDRPYATGVEGYRGLVVHGPLIATLLADLARRERPGASIAGFSFKAIRPMLDLRPFQVCGKPSADGKSAQLWAHDHEGWLTMQAHIQFD